jgi:thiaminase/transcriptional activator TenA
MPVQKLLNRDNSLFARLRAANEDVWHEYTHHPFVAGLADGSLSEDRFRHYLIQDYLFLIHFARAYALCLYKADNLQDMRAAAATIDGLLNVEMAMHVKYCEGWDLTEAEMAAAPESTAMMAYTRYVLETGLAGDVLDLIVALAPCVIGYGVIGSRLDLDPTTKRDGNPYNDWIEMYSSDDYFAILEKATEQLDRLAASRLTEARFEKAVNIFGQATRLEIGFWDMGWNISS